MDNFWQELDTSNIAVAGCDAAREDAIQAAQSIVDAGNDVALRDAAASAALDAAIRCAAASLAAREAGARCEALAEGAAANDRAEATSAAQRARAAAARCDAEGGAAAASQAANAFADSCVAACADAAAPTLAAREAAAQCVLAREHADTAAWVAQRTSISDDVHKSHKASQEFADFHKEACKDAAAAALEARRAAVRCIAASRRAVSAASVAREAASRCYTSGGDGAAARRAAHRCVEDAAAGLVLPLVTPTDGDAAAGLAVPHAIEATAGSDDAVDPDPVVPRADAAALEATKVAASCDAALVDRSPRPINIADDDKDWVDKMRGWLMTVATLFVGIAFQAILQPPHGMSFDQCTLKYMLTPSPTCQYMAANTYTMSVSLIMLVLLLTMRKSGSPFTLFSLDPKVILRFVQILMTGLISNVVVTFIIGTSQHMGAQLTILAIFFVLPIGAISCGMMTWFFVQQVKHLRHKFL